MLLLKREVKMAWFWPNFFSIFCGPRRRSNRAGIPKRVRQTHLAHSGSQSKDGSQFALPDRCLSETSWSCQRLPFFAKTPNKPKTHCKSWIRQRHQDGNAKRFASAPTKLFTWSTSLESVYKGLSIARSRSSRLKWIRIKQHPWIMSPGCLVFFR